MEWFRIEILGFIHVQFKYTYFQNMTTKSIILSRHYHPIYSLLKSIHIVNLIFLYFISLEKWIQCQCWILYQKFVLGKKNVQQMLVVPLIPLCDIYTTFFTVWHFHSQNTFLRLSEKNVFDLDQWESMSERVCSCIFFFCFWSVQHIFWPWYHILP